MKIDVDAVMELWGWRLAGASFGGNVRGQVWCRGGGRSLEQMVQEDAEAYVRDVFSGMDGVQIERVVSAATRRVLARMKRTFRGRNPILRKRGMCTRQMRRHGTAMEAMF